MRSAVFSCMLIAFHTNSIHKASNRTSEVRGLQKLRKSSSSKAQMHVALYTMMQMSFLTVIQLQ